MSAAVSSRPLLAALFGAAWGVASLSGGARAHGSAPTPETIWTSWNWSWPVLAGLAVLVWWYALGTWRLWSAAGMGKAVPYWRAGAFAGAMLALFLALISPVDALGAALFTGHMGQHMLLMMVAAPLLVLARPAASMLWGMPTGIRRTVTERMRSGAVRRGLQVATIPLVAWIVHTVAVWMWHLPALYEAALASAWVHWLEHAAFLGSAAAFWWAVIHPLRVRRSNHAVSLLALFTMALQGGALGILMLTAPQPWYSAYAGTTAAWGLTPLADQQFAGLVMWVPGGMIYLISALAVVALWMRAAEHNASRRAQAHAGQPAALTGD